MEKGLDLIFYVIKKAFCLLNSATCTSLRGVILPSSFGSTQASKDLEHSDIHSMLVDFTSAVDLSLTTEQKDRLNKAKESNDKTSYNNIYYPIAKDYLATLRKNFKNKRITLLCPDYRLLKYVGVREIIYLSPSQKLLDIHCAKYQDPNKIAQIKSSVMDVIKNKGMKATIFGSFEELNNILKDILDLRSKI